MKRIFAYFILLAGHSISVNSKRVVFVPIPNVSHTRYLTNVAQELIALGHDAWVCMPEFLADDVVNTTGLHVLRYSSVEYNTVDEYMRHVRDAYWKDKSVDIQQMTTILFHHVSRMMEDKKLERAISAVSPDLMVIDNVPNMHMIAVMAYKLDIPFAFVGSLYDPVPFRVPFTPATTPSVLFPYSDRMSFFQRLISFCIHAVIVLVDMFSYKDAVARFAPNKPYFPMRELTSRAEIILAESDTVLDYPRVSLPNFRLIGGTSVSHPLPLVDPFSSFMEKASGDVVVVSFGSYIINIPEPIANKLSNVFQRLQLNVVWRVNMTSPDPEKILTSTWVPQNDLLAHPKTKLFISHCGQSSQYEALYHGVPTLCMPIFLDQTYNAARARTKGFGLTLDLKTSTEDEMVSSIKEMYNNATYLNNLEKSSNMFRLLYGLPKERAAFWLDHVLAHGGGHLRSASQTLPGYQFYCLDIFIVCFVVSVVFSIGAMYFCKKLLARLNCLLVFIQCRHLHIKDKLS